MSELVERRQEERERRRADILDSAELVAARVGIDAMTMDLVAKQARLSRALIYVYFQDKEDLIFALCERALQMLGQRFTEAMQRQQSGIDQITSIGRAYVAFSQEFPIYFDALSRFESHEPAVAENNRNELACMQAGDQVHSLTARAIETGVADGSIRKDVGEPMLMAVTLWGFMHGIIQLTATKSNMLAKDGISVKLLVDHALRTCTRALEPRH